MKNLNCISLEELSSIELVFTNDVWIDLPNPPLRGMVGHTKHDRGRPHCPFIVLNYDPLTSSMTVIFPHIRLIDNVLTFGPDAANSIIHAPVIPCRCVKTYWGGDGPRCKCHAYELNEQFENESFVAASPETRYELKTIPFETIYGGRELMNLNDMGFMMWYEQRVVY